MNIYEKLTEIQNELKVPKTHENKFGGFWYRSAEDILDAVKPITQKYKATLYVTDTVIQIGDRYYVQAKAFLFDNEKPQSEYILATGYSREEDIKKGMDAMQITGATSAQARKYALNGLLNIDDVRDADVTNDGKDKETTKPQTSVTKQVSTTNTKEKTITLPQQNMFTSIAIREKLTEEQKTELFARYGATKIEEIKMSDFNKLLAELNKK